MSSLSPISSTLVGVAKPVSFIGNLISSGLQAITGGRSVNFWSSPSITNTKSVKNFHEFRLANGLKVIAKQAPGSQIDAQLMIKVGSNHDPKGKEGLAHFLEHIVVSNTREFGDKVDEVIGFVGGHINAHTGFDKTTYELTVPKDKLELALRVLSAEFTDLEFDNEQISKVIEKEKGIINTEAFMAGSSQNNHVLKKIFDVIYGTGSPLNNNIIGTVDTIKSIQPKDLKEFYERYYVPSNATLIVSGDFDLATLKNAVSRNFALKPSAQELPSLDLGSTLDPSKVREHSFRDNTLTASLQNFYQVPKFNHREKLIIDFLKHALSDGVNSRLYKKLIDKNTKLSSGAALRVSMEPFVDKDRGHLIIQVIPKQGKASEQSYAEYQKIIDAELQDIALHGLLEDERQRLIQEIEIDEIYNQDRQHAYIHGAARYDLGGEDWSKYLNYHDDIKSITNDEIKAFVTKYLSPANSYVFKLYSSGTDLNKSFLNILKQKTEGAKGKDSKTEIIDEKKFGELETLARGGSNLEGELCGVEKVKYNNSWELFLKRDTELPIVFAEFLIPGGSLKYPKDKSFINEFVTGLMSTMGTYNPHTGLRIDKFALDRLKEQYGIKFSIGTSLDHETVSLKAPKKYFDKAVALFNEFTKYPAFMSDDPSLKKESEKEFEDFKKSVLTMVDILEKMPGLKANKEFARILFPEGHDRYPEGFEKARQLIAKLTIDDLREAYRKYNPSPAKVTVVGDISRPEIESALFPTIASWNKDFDNKNNELDLKRIQPVKALDKPVIKVVENNDNRPESNVLVGNVTDISITDKDYYPSVLANMILGGAGLSSRLIRKLREEQGLVYHIGSGVDTNKYGSATFSIRLGCDPKNVKKSILALRETLDYLFKHGVTRQELELVKNRLKLSAPLHRLNSRESTAHYLSELQYLDRDENFVNNFNKMIDAITVEDVMRAMKRMIKPESFAIVVSKPKAVTQDQVMIKADDIKVSAVKPVAMAI